MRYITGYEGLYSVTEDGRVYSHKRHKFLKAGKTGPYRNYFSVVLCKNGEAIQYRVHRLVAETYLDNPNNLPCVNHKDENTLNNHMSNLEWCTYEYNINYGTRNAKLRKSVLCVELNRTFDSITEAARVLGLSTGNLHSALTGRYKTAGGYHWQYA